MANTPNLNITPLTQNQANKDVTLNTAFTMADLNAGVYSLAITNANATYTLTEDQYRAGVIHITGSLDGGKVATVVVPTNMRKATIFVNSVHDGGAIRIKNGASGGYTTLPDQTEQGNWHYSISLGWTFDGSSAPLIFLIGGEDAFGTAP